MMISSQIVTSSLLLISLNLFIWPISISNVACAQPETASTQNPLSMLEEDLNKAYNAIPEKDKSALKKIIESTYGDSLSSKSTIKASQIHDDYKFDLIARGLMKLLNKTGPLVISSKPGQGDVEETVWKYVVDYFNEKVGIHCKSFMDSNKVESLYADFLGQVAKNSKLELKNWKPESIEAIAIANICHYVDANPMELYLLGSFDLGKLIAKLFAKKENPKNEPKDAEKPTEAVLPADQVEGLLKTFMLVQDAYDEMFKEKSDHSQYEDLGGFAQIIGDINEEKCFSGYINVLTQALDNFSQYVHLETYLHTRILQQAQLCAKQLELIVRGEYSKQENKDFEKSIRILRKEIEKAAELGAEKKRNRKEKEIPLYVSIPDDVFLEGFKSYLDTIEIPKELASTTGDAQLYNLTEDQVMELIGNPSIRMARELGPMLIFSFDLVALIEDLDVKTDTLIDKSTLDIMTEVNICEKILN